MRFGLWAVCFFTGSPRETAKPQRYSFRVGFLTGDDADLSFLEELIPSSLERIVVHNDKLDPLRPHVSCLRHFSPDFSGLLQPKGVRYQVIPA